MPGEGADGGAFDAGDGARKPLEHGNDEAKAEVLQPLAEGGAPDGMRLAEQSTLPSVAKSEGEGAGAHDGMQTVVLAGFIARCKKGAL